MEIKEFISESIKQIFDGIVDAQVEIYPEFGSIIAPQPTPGCYGGSDVHTEVANIHFDIAVTVAAGKISKSTGKLDIKVVGGSLGKQKSKKEENTHRINFSIPFYPGVLNQKALKINRQSKKK